MSECIRSDCFFREALFKPWGIVIITAILVLGLSGPGFAESASSAPSSTPKAKIVKFTPGMNINTLAGRPDTDQIEFADGRHVSVGNIRRIEAARQQIHMPMAHDRFKVIFGAKPAGVGKRIDNSNDLVAALKRPDGETLQLPSGRRVTAAQIKFAQPEVERRLGFKLDTLPQRPNLSGAAIKIGKNTTRTDWEGILKKPESTVLESPNGKRVTVGELKQELAKRIKPKSKQTPPATTPSKS